MQRKPVLIIAAIAVVGICAFLFIRGKYLTKPKATEVIAFLDGFNTDVNAGDPDNLLKYFDSPKKAKQLNRLLNLLCNKVGSDGNKPLFYVSLDTRQSEVKLINAEILEAKVPVQFTEKVNSGNVKQTSISLRLRKVSAGVFKILRIDARTFFTDYIAYENDVRPIDNTITYSPETLEAFKTAEQLKSKYDTVVWFAHLDKKTYYYVVKGKWEQGINIDSTTSDYGMGLVNHELKEIIPPRYDLIYTINATFPGMVEVEKGHKHGFFDLDGKNVVSVDYDQILPITDPEKLAILRKGDDYCYLEKDYTVSGKANINIADYLSKIKDLNTPFDLSKNATTVVTEYNSKTNSGAVYIAPSFLADLNITSKIEDFKNPLRKGGYEEVHVSYNITKENADVKTDNWLLATFYSIRDHFLGGRGDFYTRKNIVLADKKSNKLYSQTIPVDYSLEEGDSEELKGPCNINSVRILDDSLIEIKTGAVLAVELYDSTKIVEGGPYYHYFKIKQNKLVDLPRARNFGFTKYVKMDDSYLDACYNLLTGTGTYNTRRKTVLNHITPEMLRYMKNEIFADYRYKFKDKRWRDIFANMENNSYDEQTHEPKPGNENVNDSLTVIDKYNINFIDQKLKGLKAPAKVLAAK